MQNDSTMNNDEIEDRTATEVGGGALSVKSIDVNKLEQEN